MVFLREVVVAGPERGDRLERRHRARLLRALKSWRDRTREAVDREALVALVGGGRIDTAARIILRAAAGQVEIVGGEWARGCADHGHLAAEEADETVPASGAVSVPLAKALPFSAFLGRAAATITASVRQLEDGLLATLWKAMAAVTGRSWQNPESMAQAMLDVVGLSENDANALMAYRAKLLLGDKATLRSPLRDKRFDRTVRAGPVTEDKVEAVLAGYLRGRLAYARKTIARAEALRARWTGVQAMWDSQIEAGRIDPDRATKNWHHRHDNRVRDTHLSVPRIQPDGVPLDGEFVTSAGNRLRFPGDPQAPAEEVMGCRCFLSFRMVKP